MGMIVAGQGEPVMRRLSHSDRELSPRWGVGQAASSCWLDVAQASGLRVVAQAASPLLTSRPPLLLSSRRQEGPVNRTCRFFEGVPSTNCCAAKNSCAGTDTRTDHPANGCAGTNAVIRLFVIPIRGRSRQPVGYARGIGINLLDRLVFFDDLRSAPTLHNILW
jgi:hypothetical protein